jgi:hypothetical protein
MNLFQPFLTRRQTNVLSGTACTVIGVLLALLYALHGEYRAAVAALPLCFALWGFVNLVFADRNAPQGSASRRLALGSLPATVQWVLFIGLVAFVILWK